MNFAKVFQPKDVFKYVDQLEVWRDILNCPTLQVNEMIRNPMRADRKPDCYIREYKGVLLFTDFAYPEYNSYNCIHAVAKINNITKTAATTLIVNKFIFKNNIKLVGKVVKQDSKRNKKVVGKTQSFHFNPYVTKDNKPAYRKVDAEYWTKRGINSKQLRKHNVYSVYNWYYNNYVIQPKSICYAYYEPKTGQTKLYQPYDKKRFPFSTMDKNHINYGNEHIKSSAAILTKSLKDLMVLENLFHNLNIYSVESESMIPNDLTFLLKHTVVYVFYDNDAPGIEGANKMSEILNSKGVNAEPMFIDDNEFPDCKDVDDIVVKQPHLITKFKNTVQDKINISLQSMEAMELSKFLKVNPLFKHILA